MATIRVTINSTAYCEEVEPRLLLVDFLRDNLGLKGTHIGCEDGVCGACTIILDGRAVKSCMIFAIQVDGADLLTAESLASGGELDPIQEAFREKHALQCGFCSPAMVLSARQLLARNPDPTPPQIRAGISGNICRCTGYTNIVKAIEAAAVKLRALKSGTAG
ncbi:MAG TPA: (2Fe-2S)-binding protein [Candidatus Binataceae bacterium]|nr:(2Fe-2S)-binding protein [Candidatus Binataceae bacterium]